MAFASTDDVNSHLPSNLLVTEGQDALLQISAARTIRAYLSDVVPAVTLVAWADPDSTPDVIREIAGLLIASMWYASKMAAEAGDDVPAFAQTLYDQAIIMLERIRGGQIVLEGVDTLIDKPSLVEDDFWPNSTSDPPKFTMDATF